MQISLVLTDGEKKAILHYNETIEGFIQQVIEDRARQYMKELVKQFRSEDVEATIIALPIKTRIEIEKEQKLENPIEPK